MELLIVEKLFVYRFRHLKKIQEDTLEAEFQHDFFFKPVICQSDSVNLRTETRVLFFEENWIFGIIHKCLFLNQLSVGH